MSGRPRTPGPARTAHVSRTSAPARTQRPAGLWAVVLVLAAVLGGSVLAACGGEGGEDTARTGPIGFEFSGDAATIDGQALPASVVADTLDVFRAAPAALDTVFRETDLNQPGSDQPKPTIVADIITTEISARVIEAEVARRGLTPSEGVAQLADTQIAAALGDSLAGQDAYRTKVRDRYALYVTLDQALQGTGPDDATLRAAYDKDPAAYEQACARHILVADEATAGGLLAQLRQGADFAALARASSTDPGSGAQGGDLGCQSRGAYVAPFEEAVWNGPPNTVQGPVKTEFGYHLIEVTARGPRSFEEARDDIAASMAPEPFSSLGTWLAATLAGSAITVDPRYGTWDPQVGQVTPVGVASHGLSITPDRGGSSGPGSSTTVTGGP